MTHFETAGEEVERAETGAELEPFWAELHSKIAASRTPEELVALRQHVIRQMDEHPEEVEDIAERAAPLVGYTKDELLALYRERGE